jgi:hypothetical protein
LKNPYPKLQMLTSSISLRSKDELSSYSVGKILFFLGFGVLGISILAIVLDALLVNQIIPDIFLDNSKDFFGTSINAVLSTASIVFVLVVFITENASKGYSSKFTRDVFTNKFFVSIISIILAASAFGISGDYLGLGNYWLLLGYSATITSIMLIGSLLAFAAYFIEMSNLIEIRKNKIESRLKSKETIISPFFGYIRGDKEFINEVKDDVDEFTDICLESIENSDKKIFLASLNSIEDIANSYINLSSRDSVETDLLSHINNKLVQIAEAVIEDHQRPTYAENIIEKIGDIGVKISETEGIGTKSSSWSYSLKELFYKCLNLDRSDSASIILGKLGDMCVSSIQNRSITSNHNVHRSYLNDIATNLSSSSGAYSAALVQQVTKQYQKIYISYLNIIIEGGYVEEHELSTVLEELKEILNNASQNQGFYGNQVIFANLFGINSFANSVINTITRKKELNPKNERQLKIALKQIVELLDKLAIENLEENPKDVFNSFARFVFVFNVENLSEEYRLELTKDLHKSLLKVVEKSYTSEDDNTSLRTNLKQSYLNTVALLIVFNRDNLEDLSEEFADLSDVYKEIPEDEDNRRDELYSIIKMIGAWIDNYQDISNVSPELLEILLEDFKPQKELRGKAIPSDPTMRKYGYPLNTGFPHIDGWYLRPDTLWQSTNFQDIVSEELNGENSQNYVSFHEKMRELVKSSEK